MTNAALRLVLASIPTALGQSCSFSELGTTIDFNGLKTTDHYSVDSQQYQGYKFFFNICGAIGWSDTANPETCPQGTTTSCEIQSSDNGAKASELYGQTSSWSFMADSYNQDGITIPEVPVFVTQTTESCSRSGAPHITKVFLVCNENAQVPIVNSLSDSYWDCAVNIKMETSLACASSSSPEGSVDIAVEVETDVGMFLCIFFFLGFGLYFGIGFAYLHRKGEVGYDRIIHKEFWSTIPGLITDGYQFTKEKVLEKINSSKGGGYSAV